jgi:DNA-binding NarL/FixJ family response regulator
MVTLTRPWPKRQSGPKRQSAVAGRRPGDGGDADPIAALTRREREVLALMAQGQDNATIAAQLFITDNAVHKHIGNIFAKLGLAVTDSGHRRVLAVLAYLNGQR